MIFRYLIFIFRFDPGNDLLDGGVNAPGRLPPQLLLYSGAIELQQDCFVRAAITLVYPAGLLPPSFAE